MNSTQQKLKSVSLFIECNNGGNSGDSLHTGKNRLIMEKHLDKICFEGDLISQLENLVKNGYIPKIIWEINEAETTLFDIFLTNPRTILDDIDLCVVIARNNFESLSIFEKQGYLETIVDRIIPKLSGKECESFIENSPKFIRTPERLTQIVLRYPNIVSFLNQRGYLTQQLYDTALNSFHINYQVRDIVQYLCIKNATFHFIPGIIEKVNKNGTYDIDIMVKPQTKTTKQINDVPMYFLRPHVFRKNMNINWFFNGDSQLLSGKIIKIHPGCTELETKYDIYYNNGKCESNVPSSHLCFTPLICWSSINNWDGGRTLTLFSKFLNKDNLEMALCLFSPFQIITWEKREMLKFMPDSITTFFLLHSLIYKKNGADMYVHRVSDGYFIRNSQKIYDFLEKSSYPGQLLDVIYRNGGIITTDILLHAINKTKDKFILYYYNPKEDIPLEVLMAYYKKYHLYDYYIGDKINLYGINHPGRNYNQQVQNELNRLSKEKQKKEQEKWEKQQKKKREERDKAFAEFWLNVKQRFRRAFASTETKRGYKIVSSSVGKQD